MYEVAANEKMTPVMVYTEDTLIHGQIVTRDIVRVHILLRTEGAPNYLHLLNAQIIRPDNAAKTVKSDALFVPIGEVIGFHVAPNVEIDLDYEESEGNRRMLPVKVTMGSFLLDGAIRISTQTELKTSLEVSRITWLSLYNISISNTYLAQMKVQAEMILVRPEKVSFGLMG